jgi:hypothetical protein
VLNVFIAFVFGVFVPLRLSLVVVSCVVVCLLAFVIALFLCVSVCIVACFCFVFECFV